MTKRPDSTAVPERAATERAATEPAASDLPRPGAARPGAPLTEAASPDAMPPEPARLTLPPVLDLPRTIALKAELEARRGSPLVLAAEGVERIGGLGQQLLWAAGEAWAADGQPFAIAAPSAGFHASTATLGLDFSRFLEGATP